MAAVGNISMYVCIYIIYKYKCLYVFSYAKCAL